MIVVDSSALLAISFHEPERQTFRGILSRSERCVISAVNAHETACVLRIRLGETAVENDFWGLLAHNEIEILPFDAIQMRAAAAAFDRYGKGIDSKARLNLCGLCRLCVGEDHERAAALQGQRLHAH